MACVQIGELPADEQEKTFEITNGPSKWDLMMSLFENSTEHSKGTRVVTFKLRKGDKNCEQMFGWDHVSVEITTLTRVSKSEMDWFQFKGWVNVFPHKGSRGEPREVYGSFWTNSRNGTITVSDESRRPHPGTFG